MSARQAEKRERKEQRHMRVLRTQRPMTPLDKFHLDGTVKHPTIRRHTDEQLEAAIALAAKTVPEFYTLLHGIDAYMERRRRRYRIANRLRTHGEFIDMNQDDDTGTIFPDNTEFRR